MITSKLKLPLFFLLIMGLMSESLSSPVQITNFRFSMQPMKTRLVFDSTGRIIYTAKQVSDKIIINIRDAKLIVLLNKAWLYKTPVSIIKSEQIGKNLQLILNLRKPIKLQHFSLPKPYRLVLDLQDKKPDSAIITRQQSTTRNQAIAPITTIIKSDISSIVNKKTYSYYKNRSNIEAIPVLIINKKQTNSTAEELLDNPNRRDYREVVIVIDPGHGGKDSGAIGVRGTHEKDVALAISQSLRNIINRTEGFHAVLTRNNDYFIRLRERLDIAHKYKADMFIAIHADAYKYGHSHGASIFALSQKGATSEAARWLAERENESELGQTISDKNALLRSVLIDLAQTATISSSLEIGDMILRELNNITHLHSSKVEQAGFVVLKSPDIPSLLVETGFISDSHEEKLLSTSEYQQKLAACIAAGITKHFIYHPPPGTHLAKTKHKVKAISGSLKNSLPGNNL